MKQVLAFLLLSMFALYGCQTVNGQSSRKYLNGRIESVTIDGCEYLLYFNYGITHKGNCDNHIRQ